MSVFTSSRERRLWLYTSLVLGAIISTLIFGGTTTIDRDLQNALFFCTVIGIAITIILHGLKTPLGKTEITIWIGLPAVYIMLYTRLGLAERSHLCEYSILAIFIYKALDERVIQGEKIPTPGLLSFLISFAIGALDEFVQLFLPSRVFDPIDILFNGFAAFMAIGQSMTVLWIRKKMNKN